MLTQPVHIEMLGGLTILQADRAITRFRSQKTASLLGYLAYHLDRSHPRERLIELFWPDDDPEAARNSLRVALSSLRRQLETSELPTDKFIRADRLTVQLSATACQSDVALFQAELRAARDAEPDAVRLRHLARAVEQYRGELLIGYYDDWILLERERLQLSYIHAAETLVGAYRAAGDCERALDYAFRLIVADPLREESHAALIETYIAAREPERALQHYRELEAMLRRELGVAPSPETIALVVPGPQGRIAVRPATERRDDAAPARARRPSAALPLALTRFFGRDEEISGIEAALKQGSRLLTLVGPPGSGKTRLAVEAARTLEDRFAGGVWFVSLGALSNPELIAGLVCDALLGGRTESGDLIAQCASALGSGPALLILDNAEHMAREVAAFASRLLARAPGLAVLVTSRCYLCLTGERVLPVMPLPVPCDVASPAALASVPSVELFLDRARSVRPDLALTEQNAAHVASVCRQLDGIPLALELAAAWTSAMSVSQIAQRLDHGLSLLVSHDPNAEPRHRTLRASIEWSVRLLPARARRFLTRLAVFRGGWTLEAAEAICREPRALEHLDLLQRSSLVTARTDGDQIRYAMLEPIREFALERMSAGEFDALMVEHVIWFLAKAEEGSGRCWGDFQAHWLEWFAAEHDNLRAALRWCHSRLATRDVGTWLCAALWRFWAIRGHLTEGRAWMDSFDVRTPTSDAEPQRARALNGAGLLAWTQGDLVGARTHLRQGLALSEALGCSLGAALSLSGLALAVRDEGDRAAARTLLSRCLAIRRAEGDATGVAASLVALGYLSWDEGDVAASRDDLEEGLTVWRELGDRGGVANALFGLAQVAVHEGECARARELLAESLAHRGDLREPRTIAACLEAIAGIACADGRTPDAARLAAAADGLRQAMGMALPEHERAAFDRMVEMVRRLDPAGFIRAWDNGYSLTEDDAIELGLRVCRSLRSD